jgi:hypothetical protein
MQRRISLIQKLQAEIAVARDSLKQVLEEDPRYGEANRAAKEAAAKKKLIKVEIHAQAEYQKLQEDIKVDTEEIATLQEILNTELADYYYKSGKTEIDDESGTPVKFKVVVKLFPSRGED